MKFDLSSAYGENFAHIYPQINEMILKHGTFEPSRYGDTVELLDFKTKLDNPLKRCVGGQMRDINIFFLLAEAMWIWAGRKDVEFLTIFNSRMSEFSDDGKVFHAPYGFRLRHWDIPSTVKFVDSNKHARERQDQIARGIELLAVSPETRRVAMSIWNPDFDLFREEPTKDIPCNDFLFFKNRGNKLHLTIANRSNDLHWGLPTNVFQFSFILEVMARILDLGVGKQVHNSDSLHVYVNNDNNKIHEVMKKQCEYGHRTTIYDLVEPTEMDFKALNLARGVNRLKEVDNLFNHILNSLSRASNDAPHSTSIQESKYFDLVYQLLLTYIEYTKSKRNDESRLKAIFTICRIQGLNPICHDYVLLALNWFYKRLKSEDAVISAKSEINLLSLVPELSNIDYSYVGRL